MKEPVPTNSANDRKISPLLKGALLLAVAAVIAGISVKVMNDENHDQAAAEQAAAKISEQAPLDAAADQPVADSAATTEDAVATTTESAGAVTTEGAVAETTESSNVTEDEPDELNPNVTQIKPGDVVKATKIPGTIYLRSQNDPDDLIWDRVPMYSTYLQVAPPVHQSAKLRFEDGATRGKHLYFQIARSDERMYVRLRWKDASQDTGTTVDDFRDGVAVQFALKDADTSYMMGSGPEQPVNIWYWRADHHPVENLAAGGYGSTTILDEQIVTGDGAYIKQRQDKDNAWHVVMSRPLVAKGEFDVNFARETVPMGFALWQGSDEERDGNKRVTHTWINLEPGLVATKK